MALLSSISHPFLKDRRYDQPSLNSLSCFHKKLGFPAVEFSVLTGLRFLYCLLSLSSLPPKRNDPVGNQDFVVHRCNWPMQPSSGSVVQCEVTLLRVWEEKIMYMH